MELLSEKFKRYQKATGGKKALGYTISMGLPDGVEERGGIGAVYDECIAKGITWEELLDYHPPTPPKDARI